MIIGDAVILFGEPAAVEIAETEEKVFIDLMEADGLCDQRKTEPGPGEVPIAEEIIEDIVHTADHPLGRAVIVTAGFFSTGIKLPRLAADLLLYLPDRMAGEINLALPIGEAEKLPALMRFIEIHLFPIFVPSAL